MLRTAGELKLIAFLNLRDLTPQVVEEAFATLGRDVDVRLGARMIERRQQAGAFTDLRSVLAVSGIGPGRLRRMLAAAEQGRLDPYLPPEVALPPLRRLPPVIRRMGEALLADPCLPTHLRLSRAAQEARAVGEFLPMMLRAAADLDAAAGALRRGEASPRLEDLSRVFKIPVSRAFLSALPEELRPEWRLLDTQIARFQEAMGRFVGATWLDAGGVSRAGEIGGFARGEGVAADLRLIAPMACRIADAALIEAGLLLLGMARQLEVLIVPVLFALSFCSDACSLGDTQNCTATDVVFVPNGREATDAEDFKDAVNFLNVLSWTIPGKYLSPGGKSLIREITSGLKDIKDAVDKNLVRLNGYSVFVRLEYEECVSGLCGNYWRKTTTTIEVAPPAGKKHQIGPGWRASVIERLGENERETAEQLREFQRLAERQCP